jgi:uncharacterized protein YdeI (YjbR/CyaY-like superfamily)
MQETFTPKNFTSWYNWLKENHQTKDSVWVIFYKKSSGIPSITWSESVDGALCYGWIDSTKQSIDSEKYMQYFGKRKAKSTWSKVNKDKVEKLSSQGLMHEAGLKIIEQAKQNGSWNILDSMDNLEIPDNLQKAFNENPKAKEFYDSLSDSKKKSILGWLIMAKREETKLKRIERIIECGNEGKMAF